MPYSGIAKGYHFRLYNRLQKKRHTCLEVGGHQGIAQRRMVCIQTHAENKEHGKRSYRR